MKQLYLAVFASVFVGSAVICILNSKMGQYALLQRRFLLVRNMYRREREISQAVEKQSFYERIIIPWVKKLVHRVEIALPINATAREKLDWQLTLAGSRFKAGEYTAITVIISACMAVLGSYVIYMLSNGKLSLWPGAVLGIYTGYVLRRFFLKRAITKRKQKIENQLPNIIDLLSVSVTAGLGFEQALGYVTERCTGVFVEELRMVQQQILMGRVRKDAMKGMAERCEVDEVSTFVTSVLQAEEVGISMQTILNSQSASIRQSHKQKVEEKAAKLPVKILLPIIIFVFPVLFVVLLGPAVISALGTM